MMQVEKETILIVDDHPVVLEGLSLMVTEIRPNADVITSLTAADALQHVVNNDSIDWLFIDVNLSDLSGLGLVHEIRKRKVLSNIIMLSSEMAPSVVEESLKLNVNGVLSKAYSREIFTQCFNRVERGKVFLTPEHDKELQYYRHSILLEKRHVEDRISQRQYEALLMIAKGYSNKEIANNMKITENTVKFHVSALMTLFDADNRTHCVSKAQRFKLI